MPAAVAYLGVQAIGTLLATSTIVTAVASFIAVGVVTASQRRKARRKAIEAYNASLQDRLVMTALADGRRSRVYGRVRNVDGVVFKQTHGANKEYYTLVLSLAGHEVDAIETVFFNDVAVTLDGSGYVTTAPWAGTKIVDAETTMTVTAGAGSVVLANTPIAGSVSVVTQSSGTLDEQTYSATPSVAGTTVSVTGASVNGTYVVHYQYSQDTPKARVRKYLGGPAQDLYADLSATVGTDLLLPTDKFANDASLIVTLQYDQDAFPTGVPQISAVIRGAKVLDPRTGTTAWTENPALIARDWSLYAYGGGADSDELVESAFIAAANACDVSTSFVTDSGTEVRPLYQCGIVCPLDADPSLTLGEIVESMGGQWGWAGGKLTLRAGVYRAPVAAIDQAWITDRAAIEVVAQAPTADLVNVMRPTFADAAQNYVPAPAAEVRYTAAITADGRELTREVELTGVTRAVHAQHVCGVSMREAREALTAKLPCNMRALQLELFDVVTVTLPTFGWVAKEFEVLDWGFSIYAGVMLTLRETSAAIFDPGTGFATLDVAANTLLPKPSEVEQITGVTVSSGTTTEVDRSILVRTTVSWTAAVSDAVRKHGRIEVQYWRAGVTLPTGDWQSVEAPGDATSVTITGLGQGVHYLFRVRARSNLGVRGLWSVVKTSQNAVVPLVDTPGLAGGAATLVRTVQVASAAATALSFSPNDFSRNTEIISDTFTPDPNTSGNVDVLVTASFLLTISGSGGNTAYSEYSLQHGTIWDAFAVSGPQGVASGSTWQQKSTETRRFSVPGNASRKFGMWANRLNSTDTCTYSQVEMRCEVIRR